MGDKPVSNNTYETSMLNKIGIMEALYPDLVPPQDLLATIKAKGCTDVLSQYGKHSVEVSLLSVPNQ